MKTVINNISNMKQYIFIIFILLFGISNALNALTEAEKQTVMNHLNTYFSNGDTTCN
ncbi:hypothetical protein KAOT1_09441 [Kordia algicida OT-1]|uniref:Uncharacterized protein n=1 Tax=Kordia algicida OT-1 TaxID=391587 RepID=A9E3X6_9FLAO|nr:hypothetical protein KAOT1_09441 [Kordia algicida OT-1]